jgi:DNA replication protein DnaC
MNTMNHLIHNAGITYSGRINLKQPGFDAETFRQVIRSFRPWSDRWINSIVANKTPRNACLVGDTGAGKTRTAFHIARKVQALPGPGVFWLSPDTLTNLMSNFGPGGNKAAAEKTMADIVDCELLVIDDLGSGAKISDSRRGRLYEIVDARYSQELPLLITTQYSEDELRRKLMLRDEPSELQAANAILRRMFGSKHEPICAGFHFRCR